MQNDKYNPCLAKSNGETIIRHTEKLYSQFAVLDTLYSDKISGDNGDLILFLSKYHDVGKINSRFQNKILKAMGSEEHIGAELDEVYKKYKVAEIPHGLISALAVDFTVLSEKVGKDKAKVLLTVIANHHQRVLLDENGNAVSNDIVNNLARSELASYQDYLCGGTSIRNNNIDRLLMSPCDGEGANTKIDTDERWIDFAYFKGMLNKLDYAASGDKPCEIEGVDASERVEQHFTEKGFSQNDCQRFMNGHRGENIIVIASTGIGKTEAALLWAEKSKTFYTLPLKVAINAIHDRIRQYYYDAEKVVYLHSDTLSNMIESAEKAGEKSDKDVGELVYRYSVIKSLAYPFTVCTVDQLFTFVMKSLGTEILPATLSYSKIIIDEIQSYSPRILAFLIYGLSIITKMGGKFCIMTATLPPFIPKLLESQGVRFAMPEKPFYKSSALGGVIRRHKIKLYDGELDFELIASQAKLGKVLVVANTVFRAQEIFGRLSDLGASVNLIHSRFTASDRKKKEKEIMDFATSSEVGVWVSTQIVEASLDIDFDVLHTEMCSADSLMQRFGRCYRNRDYLSDEPNCNVYMTENVVYDKEIYKRSAEYLRQYDGTYFEEEQKTEYINKVYDYDALKNTYVKQINAVISELKELFPDYIKKKKAEELFRDIKSVSLFTRADFQRLTDEGVFDLYRNGKFADRIAAQTKMQASAVAVSLKTVLFSKKANIKASAIGISGYMLTDNIYSYERGLINEIDDENNFI